MQWTSWIKLFAYRERISLSCVPESGLAVRWDIRSLKCGRYYQISLQFYYQCVRALLLFYILHINTSHHQTLKLLATVMGVKWHLLIFKFAFLGLLAKLNIFPYTKDHFLCWNVHVHKACQFISVGFSSSYRCAGASSFPRILGINPLPVT